MTKKELRKLFLDKRQKLSEAEYLQRNRLLCEYFFASVDLSFIKVLHVFLPIEKKREPNTWLIIDRIRREFPTTRISIPKVNSDTGALDNYFFEGLHQLQENVWGISEPKQGVPTPSEKIDMVLVPMLAFDKRGHRAGYGKGFYDRLLANCREDCKRIGLSLFEPVDIIDDVWPQDQIIQRVITPEGTFSF